MSYREAVMAGMEQERVTKEMRRLAQVNPRMEDALAASELRLNESREWIRRERQADADRKEAALSAVADLADLAFA